MCDVVNGRLSQYNGQPISDRIITDQNDFKPYDLKFDYIGKKAKILVKDGRIFGGDEFFISKIDKETNILFIIRDRYFGGGFARIPIDEIVGIIL